MANYLDCDICGTEKTGFGTLWFCPKCEADEPTTYDDRLYFVSVDKLSHEAVMGKGTAIFVSRESAINAVKYLRKNYGRPPYTDVMYVYSFKYKDLRGMQVLEESAPTGGEECQVLTSDLIGVPVEYVTMI